MKIPMYLSFLLAFLLGLDVAHGQDAQFQPAVYDKPLPGTVTIAGAPSNFKFTTHIVNIAVPVGQADNWNVTLEQEYIQAVFDLLPDDKHFVISQYVDFYFPSSSGLSLLHHINVQNTVENIGLPLYSDAGSYNSNELLGITRIYEFGSLNPRSVTHETMHQWNSFEQAALYWLVDPSFHTGLIEQQTSCFDNYRDTFEHVQDTVYSYRTYYSSGFVGQFEGYLAGLWDAPQTMRTLKNYYHYPELPTEVFPTYVLKHVKADEIYDIGQAELFTLYGGERIPNYQNADNSYDCVVIVFSYDDFLSDNYTKGFHYASIINEFEEPDAEFNQRYDEVFGTIAVPDHPVYGKRMLNLYHSSQKNLHFTTRLFDDVLAVEDKVNFSVSVYPNPAKDVLLFSLSQDVEILSGEVFDLQGARVMEFYSDTVDVSSIVSGMYFIRLSTDKGTFIEKVVKQ